MKIKTVILAILIVCAAGFASGQEERLEVTLERSRVSLGNPVYLNLTFYGAKNIRTPDIPPVDGLRIKYVGPATRVSIVNGRVSQSVTHNYLVIPLEEGDFSIGPFRAEYRGKVYEAPGVTLTASSAPAVFTGGKKSVSVSQSSVGPGKVSASSSKTSGVPYEGDEIFLVMDAEKKKMYVNEVVPVSIKLYVDNLRLEDVEYPSFSHEGFSAGKYKKPLRSMGVVKGRRYDVVEFKRDIFGIKEGDHTLGPAALSCKILTRKQRPSFSRRSIFDDSFFNNIFGRYQAYPLELRSKGIPVTVLPFPEEGRPDDFQGAVGKFDMDVRIDPVNARVGDPIVAKMIISGKGNLDTVTAPKLRSTAGFKVYEPQVTIKGNEKIYEQVIIPKTDKVDRTPGITFSFLDPDTGEYRTVDKGNVPVNVSKQPEGQKAVRVVSVPGEERAFYPPEKLGKDLIHIKGNAGSLAEKGRFLYGSAIFWGSQVLPFGAFAVFYAFYRKKERIRKDRGYARLLRAPKKARSGFARAKSHLAKSDIGGFYDAVFRTLQEYLGDKFDLPKGAVTTQAIEGKTGPSRVEKEIADKLNDVFSKCDMARYASRVSGKDEAEEVLDDVRRIIEYFEKFRI